MPDKLTLSENLTIFKFSFGRKKSQTKTIHYRLRIKLLLIFNHKYKLILTETKKRSKKSSLQNPEQVFAFAKSYLSEAKVLGRTEIDRSIFAIFDNDD